MAVKAPDALVVIVAGVVPCSTPSSVIVTVDVTANPLPVTVTLVPTLPEVGLRVIEGDKTVNGADMMKFVPVLPWFTST